MTYDQARARALYKKLLTFYPRAFRDQLGESMEQTFNDICNERREQTEHRWFRLVVWIFLETAIGIFREHILRITEGNIMKNILTSPRSTAVLSFFLALPLAIFFPIAMLEIEPFNGFFKNLFTAPDGYSLNVVGRIVLMGSILLLPLACIISVVPIVRNVRTGKRATANPVNLVLAVALSAFFALTWGGMFIDQLACFLGVPNCD